MITKEKHSDWHFRMKEKNGKMYLAISILNQDGSVHLPSIAIADRFANEYVRMR